jgi:hypothetical protein
METEQGVPPAIVVPIDLYGINSTALEILVGIAHKLQRNVVGLILEDLRLQQVARLPFATEIILGSGRERKLLPASLSQRHSQIAKDTCKRMQDVASKNRVELVFDYSSGSRLFCALERSSQTDIFFPARRPERKHRGAKHKGIAVAGLVLTGSGDDTKGIGIARALASTNLIRDIYLLGKEKPSAELLRELGAGGKRVIWQYSGALPATMIPNMIRESAYDLLLLPREAIAAIPPSVLDAALEHSASEVLIIN